MMSDPHDMSMHPILLSSRPGASIHGRVSSGAKNVSGHTATTTIRHAPPVQQLQINRHLKCHYDPDGRCQRCKREGEECVRDRNRIRFRQGSRASFHTTFAEDQPWVGTGGNSRAFQFVNETAGVAASYSQQDDLEAESDAVVEEQQWGDKNARLLATQTPGTVDIKEQFESSPSESISRDAPGASTSGHLFSGSISREEPHGRAEIDREQSAGGDMSGDAADASSTPLSSSSLHVLPRYRTRLPSYSAARTPSDYPSVSDFSSPHSTSSYHIFPPASLQDSPADPFWDGLVKRPVQGTRHDGQDRLQAVLLRYYAEEIADRFDLCDPERHFVRVVPQRARSCPPLLNAIFTTSARHLTRLARHRNATGVVQWRGDVLPDLTEELAVYYHNECIRDLLRLSVDPEQIHDENLLAAAIILRTDEEMDSPIRDGEGDQEVFLQMLNIFINAQVPTVTATSHRPPSTYLEQQIIDPASGMQGLEGTTHSQPLHMSSAISEAPSHPQPVPSLRIESLRQAAIRVALRQELFTSYMKHRPLKFNPFHYEVFRSFTPADDTVWAHRLVILCADVLQYCYGPSDSGTPRHDERPWHELKRYEDELRHVLPESFAPTYYRPPNPEAGEIFPEIWYLEDCHVTGTMHAELARLLLAVYNPTRPRLGHGYAASMRELTFELQKIVLRLCGIALSNRRLPSVFIEALMGIATYGEYFEDRRAQAGLLEVLDVMREEHAYPTAKIVQALKGAWGWI